MFSAICKNAFWPTVLVLLFLVACQRHDSAPNAQMAKDAAESATAPAPTPPMESRPALQQDTLNPFSTAVAVVSALDSTRRFVRTAELKFRVREVLPATMQIEDLARRNAGFVTVSNVGSEIEYRDLQPISRDSALEMTRFSVHGHLVLRVPYRQLDTTLRALHRLVDFLDYRNVKAEDVAMKLLEDQLLQFRQNDYQTDINAAAQNGKSTNKLEAADRKLNSRTAADASRLERLKLEDALQFSTVEIDIYQAAQLRQQVVANTAFQMPDPGFWQRVGDGFRSGVELVEWLLIGLAHVWVFIVLGVAFWIWRKYRRNR